MPVFPAVQIKAIAGEVFRFKTVFFTARMYSLSVKPAFFLSIQKDALPKVLNMRLCAAGDSGAAQSAA